MKIGVFDSGIGGLVITKSFVNKLNEYDFVYYGDTKNLPYGNKTPLQVLRYTIEAVEYLISQDAKLIVIACNTASAIALRYIQQRFIPQNYPEIKVLGVVIPTLEEAILPTSKKMGIIATPATIKSQVYSIELNKLTPELETQEIAAPELVPAIENNDFILAESIIKSYVSKFENVDSLVLGCTHYPLIKDIFQKHFKGVNIISSDNFMGEKLKAYLDNHPEIECVLDKTSQLKIFASEVNEHYKEVAKIIFPNTKVNLA
ncbi:MAG: glutamate racemase [Alphaproteobacteria bacterium]